MSITTSQQISRYYDLFQYIEVVFTQEVIGATNLCPKQVYLKCLGDQWNCIVYSSSMIGAKIIANTGPGSKLVEKTRQANNLVSLRFSFKQNDKNDPLTFFVAAKIVGFSTYDEVHPELQFVSLAFTQRPPDDLIEILGRLLEANVNSRKRKEERITLTTKSMRRIGIRSKETVVYVDGVPRKCLLRDISFSGAKVIAMGIAKFLLNRDASLRLELEDPAESISISGTVLRMDPVEGRKDLGVMAIRFNEDAVPMSFKMRLNEYLSRAGMPGFETE